MLYVYVIGVYPEILFEMKFLYLLNFMFSLLFHSLRLSVASIPEGGQASVQPHPAHPGSQGRHEEQPLNPSL